MSPLDRTLEFQRAFEKAEIAWYRWKKSPLGDTAYEKSGEALLQAFIDAATTYLDYARRQTAIRRRDPSPYAKNASPSSDEAHEAELDIPDFLRRQAN